MDQPTKPVLTNESKIFDPRDRSTSSGGAELLDATVVQRGWQWGMYLAGEAAGYGPTEIYSASLPRGIPLLATGWELTRDALGELVPVAGRNASRRWDGGGGRHCPSFVKGWDPRKQKWAERIYYAGAAENLWGPYTIGFLEWDGKNWVDQPEPAFTANEDWERASVYEPNLIYHDGRRKMWYVAGWNQEDYLLQGLLGKRRRPNRLEQPYRICVARNENVRLLCFAAGRIIWRDLRARLGRNQHAAR